MNNVKFFLSIQLGYEGYGMTNREFSGICSQMIFAQSVISYRIALGVRIQDSGVRRNIGFKLLNF
ncbi:hypothetical protein ACP6PL_21140 [Dapis sp. BLCC M126]|uniref:hypothetical protein n=1 Tax=Dapis sp. BLCC M126 TaxID=3400189 RepID=UPI003CF91A93